MLKNLATKIKWFSKKINFRYAFKKQEVHKKFPWTSLGISITILIIAFISISKINGDTAVIHSFFDNFKKLFHFADYHDGEYDVYTISDTFSKSIRFILKTIGIAFIGTIIGSVCSLPLAFLASKNTIKYKAIYIPVRIALSLLRAFPPILIAYLFKFEFLPDTNGILTISIFVASIMSKWMYEEFDSIDLNAQIMLESFGANKWIAFKNGILPQVKQKYISLCLYSFEMTVRFASILGVVGLTGIGVLIDRYKSIPDAWGHLFIVILVIVVFVIFVELLSWLIKKYILDFKVKDYSENFKSNNFKSEKEAIDWTLKNPRRIWIPNFILTIIIISLTIYFFINLNLGFQRNTNQFPILLKAIFKPDWKYITTWSNENAIKLAFEALGMVICSILIGTILAIPIGLIASKNIVPLYVSSVFRFILILIRSVPAYLYAIIFFLGAPIESKNFVGALALGIHAIGMMGKLIAESADNIDKETLVAGEAFGMGIFSKMKYIIWKEVKPQVFSTAIYRLEVNFKQTVMLGALGISSFGYEMLNATSSINSFGKASSFIIVTIAVVLFLEQISNITRLKINRGYIFRKPRHKYNDEYYQNINLNKI
ncbi:MAG: ABC transporter permease subunit [Mycoplasma sp.]|nr:ABC transporter permease subunit [Mycoplasma sp.]